MWALPPPDPGFDLLMSSRGMSKGLAQTEGVQVLPRGFIQLGQVQIGGQWKNITSPVAEGEAAAFVTYAPKVGAYQLSVTATYKAQTNVKMTTDDKSFEFTASGSCKWGKVSARLSAVYSPDDLGSSRRSLFVEGGSSFDLTKTIRLSANLGRRERVAGTDYTSFNTGVSKTLFQKLTVDLRYYDTAQSELGEIYRGRAIVSAKLAI